MFRNFLKKEHSEENLDFWLAVDQYRQNDIIKAKFIYSKFLIPGATFEVIIEFYLPAVKKSFRLGKFVHNEFQLKYNF